MASKAVSLGFAAFVLVGLSVPVGAAEAPITSPVDDCMGPPCGLIPVLVTISVDKWKDLTFGTSDTITVQGEVEYYWDIDQDGYAYDAQKTVEMTLGLYMERVPGWIEPKITPTKVTVPVRPQDGCNDCVQPDNAQGQGHLMFRWVQKFTVTLTQTRDYDAKEVAQYVRHDGLYRITLFASTTDSLAGNAQTGQPAGLLEGYGTKDLRFVPEPLKGVDGSKDAQQTVPGAPLIGGILAFGAAILLYRRRQ